MLPSLFLLLLFEVAVLCLAGGTSTTQIKNKQFIWEKVVRPTTIHHRPLKSCVFVVITPASPFMLSSSLYFSFHPSSFLGKKTCSGQNWNPPFPSLLLFQDHFFFRINLFQKKP